jgi:hypothetical protein
MLRSSPAGDAVALGRQSWLSVDHEAVAVLPSADTVGVRGPKRVLDVEGGWPRSSDERKSFCCAFKARFTGTSDINFTGPATLVRPDRFRPFEAARIAPVGGLAARPIADPATGFLGELLFADEAAFQIKAAVAAAGAERMMLVRDRRPKLRPAFWIAAAMAQLLRKIDQGNAPLLKKLGRASQCIRAKRSRFREHRGQRCAKSN